MGSMLMDGYHGTDRCRPHRLARRTSFLQKSLRQVHLRVETMLDMSEGFVEAAFRLHFGPQQMTMGFTIPQLEGFYDVGKSTRQNLRNFLEEDVALGSPSSPLQKSRPGECLSIECRAFQHILTPANQGGSIRYWQTAAHNGQRLALPT